MIYGFSRLKGMWINLLACLRALAAKWLPIQGLSKLEGRGWPWAEAENPIDLPENESDLSTQTHRSQWYVSVSLYLLFSFPAQLCCLICALKVHFFKANIVILFLTIPIIRNCMHVRNTNRVIVESPRQSAHSHSFSHNVDLTPFVFVTPVLSS